MTAPLRLSIEPLELPFVHPFTIARGTEHSVRTAIFRLAWNGIEALGETTPSARYAESVETVLDYFERHQLEGDDPYLLDELLECIEPRAARCGLDVALHDLIAKDCGRPLYRLLGLDPRDTPLTSFTVGIGDTQTMLARVDEIGEHPVLKVKLGTGTPAHEIETMQAIRERYGGTIRIDANEGWDVEQAVTVLRELHPLDIEFCEQPIPAGHPEQLRYIREHCAIPIVTDEDSRVAEDLPALYRCVDGINIKLVKCGGIRGALHMIHTARALGLKIMLGSMVETQVLTTAAAQLSPLVDWADLDGPFLAITYDAGKIVLPDGAGLGVRQETAVA